MTKLLSLIQTESSYFTPLNRFSDAREGMYRSIDIDRLDFFSKKNSIPELKVEDYIKHYKSNSGHRNFGQCWFKAEYESFAMWNIYGKGTDSIAIQSDLKFFDIQSRYYNCITDNRDWTINIDKIKYVPWTSVRRYLNIREEMKDDDLFWYKDESFAYENEWRLIINFTQEKYLELSDSDKNGLNIKVDINKLIQNIYVSPNCSRWRYETIKSMLQEYGILANIGKSRIC